MAGAGPSRKALLNVILSCSSKAQSTIFRASYRRQHFSSRTSNWTPQSYSSSSASAWAIQKRYTVAPKNRSTQTAITTSPRAFSSTPTVSHGHIDPPKPGEERKITFIDKEGDAHTFLVADGDNLLDIAQANELDMEGACGGSCACSTCHVVVDSNHFDLMEEPDDEENDMLDLAFGLTETSRLGCQVKMSKDLDGLVVKLPTMTRNLQASDFK